MSTKVIAPQDTHVTSKIDQDSETVTKENITKESNKIVEKDFSDDLSKRSVNEFVVKEHSVNFSSDTAVLEFKTVPKSEMSKDLNFHAQPNKGLYINALYGTNVVSVSLQVLIDCGATMSLLSRSALQKIPEEIRPTLEESENKVKFADGSVQKADGLVTLNLKVGHTKERVSFLVGNFTDEAILGMNDLHTLGFQIDFSTMTVLKGDLAIPVQDIYCNSVTRKVVVRKSVTLAPRTESIIEAHVVNNETSKCDSEAHINLMLEPVKSLLSKKCVLPAKSIHSTGQENIPVLLYNPNADTVTLEENTVVGMLVNIPGVISKMTDYDKVDELFDDKSDACILVNVSHETCGDDKTDDTDVPHHLVSMYNDAAENLDASQKLKLKHFLLEYADVFSKDDFDLGSTNIIECSLDTGDSQPIKQAPRRLGPDAMKAADTLIQELLDKKLITPSKSPWASPIVMVKKKNGSYRMCIDFRLTNMKLKADGYPLPRIQSSLDCLSNAKWFCSNDMTAGYWQIRMDPNSCEKTAFCHQNGPSGGLYEWLVMPFGLKTAPGCFQRLMDKLLSDLRYISLLVYLDDILVFGSTFEETLSRLGELLRRLRNANLKLKPAKCKLFRKSLEFLGHVVSEKGISCDPKKIEVVKSWPRPKNQKEVKSLLGLASYYRRFLNNFSTIAKPLTNLTSPKTKFEWSDECEEAFKKLKELLTSAPVLGYPQDEGTFILDTDASNVGLGAVLSQVQTHNGEQVERVIAYGSRTLSEQEIHYCITRKELLAVIHHVKLFKNYLLGRHFIIRTDHSSLKYLNRFKEPEGQLARWLDFLQPFDYEIVHRSGSTHSNADGLSRQFQPCKMKKCYCQKFSDLEYEPDVVIETKVTSDVGVQTNFENVDTFVDCSTCTNESKVCNVSVQPLWTEEEMANEQRRDQKIGPVVKWLEDQEEFQWSNFSKYGSETKQLLFERERLVLRGKLMYRKWENSEGDKYFYQLIVPDKYREDVVKQLHDNATAGHLGVKRTLTKMRARFFWPHMTDYVKRWVRTCKPCQMRKSPSQSAKGGMHIYLVGSPGERLEMDVMGPFSETDAGNRWLLVIGDVFTKYCIAVPLPNITAATVAEAFVSNWISYFGVPFELHTDKASYFQGKVFTEVCKILGLDKTRTTSFRPMSDGFVERVNQSLNNMLNCVIVDSPFNWDLLIKMCVLAYNSSTQESTGETPAMLMLGREVKLPVDLVLPYIGCKDSQNIPEYVLNLQSRLEKVHENARLKLQKAAIKQQHWYNNRLKENIFSPGSLVYYNCPIKGNAPKESYYKWKGPYVVVQKFSNAVYKIALNANSKRFVVNHDRLKQAHVREEIDTSWVKELSKDQQEVNSDEAESEVDEETDLEIDNFVSNRPQRQVKPPQRFGEWYM